MREELPPTRLISVSSGYRRLPSAPASAGYVLRRERHLPRSACGICPYRSDEHWIELKQSEPSSYEDAVKFDEWLRKSSTNSVRTLVHGHPYLHPARRPLATVIAEREAGHHEDEDLFTNECDGICGV